MLFMGEEWGATTPWQYFTDHTEPRIAAAVRRGRRDEFAEHGWNRSDVPDPQAGETVARSHLDWDELRLDQHRRLFWWYRDLIRLRRERGDLRDPRLDRVHVDHDPDEETVVVWRGAHAVVVNLATQPRTIGLDPPPGDRCDPPVERHIVLAWDPADATFDGTLLTLPAESAAVVGPVARSS